MDSLLWCAGWELNPHALRHMALNHACLPIPAPALVRHRPLLPKGRGGGA